MIRSFGDRATERFYHGEPSWFPPGTIKAAFRKLDVIHAASNIGDLASPPGNRLEPLKGNLEGWYSVRVNRQWRVIFRWSGQDAYDVMLVDYHR